MGEVDDVAFQEGPAVVAKPVLALRIRELRIEERGHRSQPQIPFPVLAAAREAPALRRHSTQSLDVGPRARSQVGDKARLRNRLVPTPGRHLGKGQRPEIQNRRPPREAFLDLREKEYLAAAQQDVPQSTVGVVSRPDCLDDQRRLLHLVEDCSREALSPLDGAHPAVDGTHSRVVHGNVRPVRKALPREGGLAGLARTRQHDQAPDLPGDALQQLAA